MKLTSTILYSFRRCPYAMRARMAIAGASLTIELREVILKNKPEQLLDISPKGTVPVLLLDNGKIIDESLDIMIWALNHKDSHNWLKNGANEEVSQLIHWNDNEFKYSLDRYKYADRYPERTEEDYRDDAGNFLIHLEQKLSSQRFLCGNRSSLADIAIFPFIRQFANVDYEWFQASEYHHLNRWLNKHTESALFTSIMIKYPAWQTSAEKLIITF